LAATILNSPSLRNKIAPEMDSSPSKTHEKRYNTTHYVIKIEIEIQDGGGRHLECVILNLKRNFGNGLPALENPLK